MHARWLFGNFADPQHDLTRDEQKRVSAIAHERYMPAGTLVAWTLVGVVLPVGLAYPLLPMFLGWLGWSGPSMFAVTFVSLTALTWPLSAWVYGHVYTKAVRRAMRDIGHDVCVDCGYRLDELPADVAQCPECGSARDGAT